VRRRHGLLDGTEEVRAESIEIDLVAQLIGKGVDRTCSVEARAVKSAVDDVLHTPTDRLEQREAGERSRGDGEL
jgi:hypothetical protein